VLAVTARKERGHLKSALKCLRRGDVPSAVGIGEVDEKIDLARAKHEELSQKRRELLEAHTGAITQIVDAISKVASDRRFREALTWQNRSVLRTAVEPLSRRPEGRRSSRDRDHEALLASYLQRYCTKNDTIGFFGPVGWARLGPSGSFAVEPGTRLVAARTVYFEQWAVDALADAIGRDEPLRRWMAPRRFGFVSIDGDVVNSPMGGRRAMPRAHAALLAACDGARSAAEIAAAMLDGHPDAFDSVDSVLTVLADLHDEKLVAWGIELPLRWRPDERLRHELSRVGDEKVRADALRKVDELEASRRAVAEAAGDPDALDAALEALEQ
jgi:hypothetical protein